MMCSDTASNFPAFRGHGSILHAGAVSLYSIMYAWHCLAIASVKRCNKGFGPVEPWEVRQGKNPFKDFVGNVGSDPRSKARCTKS